MPATSKFDKSISSIVKQIELLSKQNIPAVLSYLHKGKIFHVGSKSTRDYLKAIPELQRELEKDALALCRDEDVLELTTNSDEDMNEIILPAPIDLLNRKETIKVLRSVIVYDHKSEENNSKSEPWIRYGDSSWEPSFWPNRLWNWNRMINFSNVTVKQLHEQGLSRQFKTVVDFFKHVITIAFDQLDLDINDFLAETFDKEDEMRRKKSRHLKTVPTIARSPEIDTPDDVQHDSELDHQADGHEVLPSSEEEFAGQNYEYRAPAEVSEQDQENDNLPRTDEPRMESSPQESLENLFLVAETEDIPAPSCIAQNVWINTIIKRNKQGSSSITRAAVQSLGHSENTYWRLKCEIHEKIIAFFDELGNIYKFPVELHEESGSKIILANRDELVKYLRTARSFAVYNIPLAEILVLGHILGGSVHVLHQGDGTGPWVWDSHTPIAPDSINTQSKFYSGKDLYLITGNNVNFYWLTVSKDTLPRTINEPENESQNDAIIREAEETVDTGKFSMVPIATLKKKNEPEVSGTVLRRSARESKKTERYMEFQQKKNKAQKKNSKNDKNEEKNEFEILAARAASLNQKLRMKKNEDNRLREMGEEIRNALTHEDIQIIFNDNLAYFENILNGKKQTWRAKWYKAGKEDALLFKLIASPFSDEQQNMIYEETRKVFLKNGMSRFVDMVLLPEIYIRIYQVFFKLSKNQAEKNLSDQSIYYQSSSSSSNELLL